MIDRRIHECATEIDALPVKPPYDNFKTMVHYILGRHFPEAVNGRVNTVRRIRTDWVKRADRHMGACEGEP